MAERRTKPMQEGLRALIAAVLAFGIFTTVRREAREPADSVPETFAPPIVVPGDTAHVTTAGGEVDEVVTEVKRTVEEARRGFLGFDTFAYPGDEAMRKWKESSPYQWVGYYLPAPCHKDDSWSGKRERLEGMGWGIAVIYVGQQVWAGIPKNPGISYITRTIRRNGRARRVREARTVTLPDCAAGRINAAQGTAEADDAIARTVAEGFPVGTVIYLDIERVEIMPERYQEYYKAWTDRVLADGRFHVGAYVHTHNANVVFADMKEVFAKHGVTEDPHMWIAKGSGFHPEAIPDEVGHAFAMAWQGVLDVTRKYAGIKLPIDENVSDRPNPSAPVD
jgi:hypothetical protein